jgi:hypothetical protein
VEFNIWFLFVPYAAAGIYFLFRRDAWQKLVQMQKDRKAGGAARAAGAAASKAAARPSKASTPAVAEHAGPAGFRPGFRDVRWGDAPTGEMTLLKSDGDESLYMRSSDTMKLGEGRLRGINYQYWKNRCAGVLIQISPGSLERVLEALTASYGKASQPRDNKSKFYWMSLGTGESATQAMVDADLERQTGTLVIFSKTIADERKAADAPAAEGTNPIGLGPPAS